MNSLEGKTALEFTLEGSDGKQHSLKDYAGKTVVLYFYPKDDTPGCAKEACGFRDLNHDIQAKGAVVLGVSRDDFASHEDFREKYKLPFLLLSDPDANVMKQYGAFGKKLRHGKEVEGVIRSTVLIGKDGKVLKHWTSVKNAETHPEEVLAVLG